MALPSGGGGDAGRLADALVILVEHGRGLLTRAHHLTCFEWDPAAVPPEPQKLLRSHLKYPSPQPTTKNPAQLQQLQALAPAVCGQLREVFFSLLDVIHFNGRALGVVRQLGRLLNRELSLGNGRILLLRWLELVSILARLPVLLGMQPQLRELALFYQAASQMLPASAQADGAGNAHEKHWTPVSAYLDAILATPNPLRPLNQELAGIALDCLRHPQLQELLRTSLSPETMLARGAYNVLADGLGLGLFEEADGLHTGLQVAGRLRVWALWALLASPDSLQHPQLQELAVEVLAPTVVQLPVHRNLSLDAGRALAQALAQQKVRRAPAPGFPATKPEHLHAARDQRLGVRRFLRYRLAQLTEALRAHPALVATKWQAGVAGLAQAADELDWYFRLTAHEAARKRPADFADPGVPGLLHVWFELRDTLLRYSRAAQQYHRLCLAGVDRELCRVQVGSIPLAYHNPALQAALRELATPELVPALQPAPAVPVDEAKASSSSSPSSSSSSSSTSGSAAPPQAMAAPAAAKPGSGAGGSPPDAAPAPALDGLRQHTLRGLAQLLAEAGSDPAQLADCAALHRVFDRAWLHSRVADEPERALRRPAASGFAWLVHAPDQLNELLRLALAAGDCSGHPAVVLRILREGPLTLDPRFCPEEYRNAGRRLVLQANAALNQIAAGIGRRLLLAARHAVELRRSAGPHRAVLEQQALLERKLSGLKRSAIARRVDGSAAGASGGAGAGLPAILTPGATAGLLVGPTALPGAGVAAGVVNAPVVAGGSHHHTHSGDSDAAGVAAGADSHDPLSPQASMGAGGAAGGAHGAASSAAALAAAAAELSSLTPQGQVVQRASKAAGPQPGHESRFEHRALVAAMAEHRTSAAALCADLFGLGDTLVVGSVRFAPAEYLRTRLLYCLRAYLRSLFFPGGPERPHLMAGPAEVLQGLCDGLQVFRLAGHFSRGLEPGQLAREVLLAELGDPRAGGPGDLLGRPAVAIPEAEAKLHRLALVHQVAQFYVRLFDQDLAAQGVADSRARRCFVGRPVRAPGSRPAAPADAFLDAARVTDRQALAALGVLLGPSGVRVVDNAVLRVAGRQLQAIAAGIARNAGPLALVAGNFLVREKWLNAFHTFQDLEEIGAALVRLGCVLRFRELLRAGLGQAVEQAAPHLRSAIAGALQLVEPERLPGQLAQLSVLGRDAGLTGGEPESERGAEACPRAHEEDPDFVAVLRGTLQQLPQAEAYLEYLPDLLAFGLCTQRWKDAVFEPGLEGFTNNVHCAGAASLALLTAYGRYRAAGQPQQAEKLVQENLRRYVRNVAHTALQLSKPAPPGKAYALLAGFPVRGLTVHLEQFCLDSRGRVRLSVLEESLPFTIVQANAISLYEGQADHRAALRLADEEHKDN